jgi:hypothetical protein
MMAHQNAGDALSPSRAAVSARFPSQPHSCFAEQLSTDSPAASAFTQDGSQVIHGEGSSHIIIKETK